MYNNPQCNRFVEDMEKAGLITEHYHSRFFWEGPAVRVGNLQDAFSNTKIPCRYDQTGLGFIVYPQNKGKQVVPTPTHKTKLNTAFKTLRKAGYFARQNFMCCQGCGWAAISEDKASKVVFYHAQDAEVLEFGNIKPNDRIYLAWAGNGAEIVKILSDAGLVIDWDGTNNTRIAVCGGANAKQ